MFIRKNSIHMRVLITLLVVMMLITNSLAVNVVKAETTEDNDSINSGVLTFSVENNTGKVDEVELEYKILLDGTEDTTGSVQVVKGEAVIDILNYQEAIEQESTVVIEYKIIDNYSGNVLAQDSYEIKSLDEKIGVTVSDFIELNASVNGAGTVEVDGSSFTYSRYTEAKILSVRISPDEGNWISGIKINNVELTESAVVSGISVSGEAISFKLSLEQNTQIVANFEAKKSYDYSAILFDDQERLTLEEGVYVYRNPNPITLSSDYGVLMLDDGKTETTITKPAQIIKASINNQLYSILNRWGSVNLPNKGINILIDNAKPTIKLAVDNPNSYGYYNSDVKVRFDAEDPEVTIPGVEGAPAFSGIEKVIYWVTCDGKITQGKGADGNKDDGILYKYDGKKNQSAYSGEVIIDTANEKNDGDNIEVVFEVYDRVGNVSKEVKQLKIMTVNPKVSVSIDGEKKEKAKDGFYAEDRTAKISIVDKEAYFDNDALYKGINVIAKDKNGKNITIDKSKIVKIESNGDNHSVEILFDQNAYYEWSLNYTNKAGLSEVVREEKGVDIYEFTVDQDYPTGKIILDENGYNSLLERILFKIYKTTVTIMSASGNDNTSDVEMSYYLTDKEKALDVIALNKIEESEYKKILPTENVELNPEQKLVAYLRIIDSAGNYTYLCSDGHVLDTIPSEIKLEANTEQINDIYNKDVSVKVTVKDPGTYSGINKVSYKIIKDGKDERPTQQGSLYSFNVEEPEYSDLVSEWTETIIVDSEKNNSSDVKVVVTAVDNAGNSSEQILDLDIDIIAPTIKVEYEGKANKKAFDDSYFTERKAIITVFERQNHFDSKDATESIKKIVAKDIKKDNVSDAIAIGDWNTVANTDNPDLDKHTMEVVFQKDANYEVDITYTDKAGNKSDSVDVKGQIAPFKFTVDKTSPTGTVSATTDTSSKKEWTELLESLEYGIWAQKSITIDSTASDSTSPIQSIEYIHLASENVNDLKSLKTKDELAKIKDAEWKAFEKFNLQPESRSIVYIRITDNSGNTTFLSTNGMIVDSKMPDWESVEPVVTLSPMQPINGIYSGNVRVDIAVSDPIIKGASSGLKEVSYRVVNSAINSQPTQEETLFKNNQELPKLDDLKHTWNGSITVDASKNNSNEVNVIVKAVDNSGNITEKTLPIKIDITRPTIDVSYDNNNADSGKYFKQNRTATIVITERNFNADNVVIDIGSSNGVKPTISGWSHSTGTGNRDNSIHTATITYSSDSDYTFNVTFKDMAGNTASATRFANGTVAGTEFTIDKTIPTISVTYNNNSAQNGNYYKESRTATITITEHNFDSSRVTANITANNNGAAATVPTLSGWSNSGDTHTATVVYPGDALYTFDIDYIDMAGNPASDFTPVSFYVDVTAPKITITGVENNSANKGVVAPVIEYSDTNFDNNTVEITLVGANREDVKLIGDYSTIPNGGKFTFADFEYDKLVDDIYTLKVKLIDKAGNTTEETINFSVNRFGSTYKLGDETNRKNGLYSKDPFDVVIIETNVDSIKNVVITLFKNNKTFKLEPGKDYKIETTGGDGEWYHNTYTIFGNNFTDDGTYRITVRSEDAAGNVAENTLDTKGVEVNFGIDKTLPTINIKNVEDNSVYAYDKLPVLLTIRDNLLLSKIEVYLDGILYKTWEGDELASLISNGEDFTFEILGDSTAPHDLRVVAYDAANNLIEEQVSSFYVTTNAWVRFYNNKPAFYGSIAGILALVAGTLFFIIGKRRKKDEEQ